MRGSLPRGKKRDSHPDPILKCSEDTREREDIRMGGYPESLDLVRFPTLGGPVFSEEILEIHEWIENMEPDEVRELLQRLVIDDSDVLELLRRERALRGGDLGYIKEQVEFCFKPRRGFYNYYQADDYAQVGYEALHMLVQAATDPMPGLLKVIERAITLATRVVLRSDSSSGMQGDLLDELLGVHAQTFQRLSVQGKLTTAEQRRVVDWLFKYRYGGTQDLFDPDIVRYAGALDQKMIERYRGHLESLPDANSRYSQYALVRLAVVDRDADAIIAAHGGEDPNFLQVESMLADLEEAELPLHCLRVAQKARKKLGSSAPWYKEPDFLDRLENYYLAAGTPEDAVLLRLERHEQVGTGSSFNKLRALTEKLGEWEEHRPRAEALLQANSPDAYLAYLLEVGRDEEAWQFLQTLEYAAVDLREEALARRSRTHPGDVIAGYEALIEETLVPTQKRAYYAAAKLMKQLRRIARAAGEDERFNDFVAQTLQQNKRRTTCIAIFERAGFTAK